MFEVGKEVVCLRNLPKCNLRRGDKRTILSVRVSNCKCKIVLLDVGACSVTDTEQCSTCGHKQPSMSSIWWLGHYLFAPIDNTLSDTTSEEILTEIAEMELVNG